MSNDAKSQNERIKAALSEHEADKKAIAKLKAEFGPALEREIAERESLLERIFAIDSQAERRKLLDAAGLQDMSAAPRPLTPLRGKSSRRSIGVAAPGMLNVDDVLSRDVENRVGLFEQGIQGTLRFLVIVPGVGACRVPMLALEAFKSGAEAEDVDDMVEHYHGEHSGPYTIKANCLHVLEDDWNKFEAKFEAAVEKLEAMELAAQGDDQRWIAGRRLWRISEAVRFITSMPEFGVSCEAFLRRVASAIEGKRLVLRDVEHGEETTKFAFPEMFSDCHWTYAEDFNAWLEAAGFCEPYRLPLEAHSALPKAEHGRQSVPSQGGKEARQALRYQMCVDAKLAMPKDDYGPMPRGIGALAKELGITRQAFTEDVKAHIARLNGKK